MRSTMDRIRCRRRGTADYGNHGDRRYARGQRDRHLLYPRDFLCRGDTLGSPRPCRRTDSGSDKGRLKMRYVVALLAVFLNACAVGPNYHRPAVQIPEDFRAPDTLAPLPPSKAESLADLKWFEVFKD